VKKRNNKLKWRDNKIAILGEGKIKKYRKS
jgi:hypothetical protein